MAAADAAASITARAGSRVASRLRHRKRSEDVVIRFERIRIDLPSQKRMYVHRTRIRFLFLKMEEKKTAHVFLHETKSSNKNNFIELTDVNKKEKLINNFRIKIWQAECKISDS